MRRPRSGCSRSVHGLRLHFHAGGYVYLRSHCPGARRWQTLSGFPVVCHALIDICGQESGSNKTQWKSDLLVPHRILRPHAADNVRHCDGHPTEGQRELLRRELSPGGGFARMAVLVSPSKMAERARCVADEVCSIKGQLPDVDW